MVEDVAYARERRWLALEVLLIFVEHDRAPGRSFQIDLLHALDHARPLGLERRGVGDALHLEDGLPRIDHQLPGRAERLREVAHHLVDAEQNRVRPSLAPTLLLLIDLGAEEAEHAIGVHPRTGVTTSRADARDHEHARLAVLVRERVVVPFDRHATRADDDVREFDATNPRHVVDGLVHLAAVVDAEDHRAAAVEAPPLASLRDLGVELQALDLRLPLVGVFALEIVAWARRVLHDARHDAISDVVAVVESSELFGVALEVADELGPRELVAARAAAAHVVDPRVEA